jgi:hypothetical protein
LGSPLKPKPEVDLKLICSGNALQQEVYIEIGILRYTDHSLYNHVGRVNMKANFIILLIAEAICLAFLLDLIRTPFTLRTAIAQSAYVQNPTEENRHRYEEARAQDQQHLKVQRVLFGLALILTTSLLWRTAVRLRSGPLRPGGRPTNKDSIERSAPRISSMSEAVTARSLNAIRG